MLKWHMERMRYEQPLCVRQSAFDNRKIIRTFEGRSQNIRRAEQTSKRRNKLNEVGFLSQNTVCEAFGW